MGCLEEEDGEEEIDCYDGGDYIGDRKSGDNYGNRRERGG